MKGYETESWREPTTEEGDKVLFSEHGRGLDGTDYRSHWLMLVKQQFGRYALLVKHGGGQERIQLGSLHHYRGRPRIIEALTAMDSDSRYLMLYTFYDIHTQSRRNENARTADTYKRAFVEGRLKKRKVRGQSAYKVEIVTI
jgi:hypothetical protein